MRTQNETNKKSFMQKKPRQYWPKNVDGRARTVCDVYVDFFVYGERTFEKYVCVLTRWDAELDGAAAVAQLAVCVFCVCWVLFQPSNTNKK